MEEDIETLETENGQKVLAFHIPRASYDLRPIFLTQNPLGHTYKRRHEGDYLCTDDEVRQMFTDANIMKLKKEVTAFAVTQCCKKCSSSWA